MRIYYDTEFTSLDGNVDWDLISAGFVAEDGQEWYVEITDFDRAECSPFVVETVLPLLGRVPAERMASEHFGWRLAQWLDTFNQNIDLVSDANCDWFLVNGYACQDFEALRHKVRGQVWQRSGDQDVQIALQEAELRFWFTNPGMQHHALFDARRFKMLAELQAGLGRPP